MLLQKNEFSNYAKVKVRFRHRVMTASNKEGGDSNSSTKPQNPMQGPESPGIGISIHK